jgi:hypothetical protein
MICKVYLMRIGGRRRLSNRPPCLGHEKDMKNKNKDWCINNSYERSFAFPLVARVVLHASVLFAVASLTPTMTSLEEVIVSISPSGPLLFVAEQDE